MKKLIIGLLLTSTLLLPIGANASDSKTFTIDNTKVTAYVGDWKWVDVNSNKYYIKSLEIQKGWLCLLDHDAKVPNGQVPPRYWYYLDSTTGKMLNNVVIDGYIIGTDGKVINKSDNNVQILSGDIAKTITPIVAGWNLVSSKWYYFNKDLTMLVNTTTPDGYKIGADGVWIQ
ncbi:hypothetical protein [Clostridium saccharoperbutylacetonicum]|uniref:hypothetical protein n=1 Tax=Clostridium saccharoperbutylacetonicum TaxID=36745 RepID=UPI0039EC58EB